MAVLTGKPEVIGSSIDARSITLCYARQSPLSREIAHSLSPSDCLPDVPLQVIGASTLTGDCPRTVRILEGRFLCKLKLKTGPKLRLNPNQSSQNAGAGNVQEAGRKPNPTKLLRGVPAKLILLRFGEG